MEVVERVPTEANHSQAVGPEGAGSAAPASVLLRVICSYCSGVLQQGAPGAGVSHGIGPCCWARARREAGLQPKPYPGRPA
jgi:hypothetical protein